MQAHDQLYCANHPTTYICQIITPYTLNLQCYRSIKPHQVGGKEEKEIKLFKNQVHVRLCQLFNSHDHPTRSVVLLTPFGR